MLLLLLLAALSQEAPIPAPPSAPAQPSPAQSAQAQSAPAQPAPAQPEGPPVFSSAKGPILLPNQCADVDLSSLGLTCTEEEPCPTFLEISNVESVNNVIVLAGNLHTQSNTLQSVLLVSEDGGATWRESHPRIKAGVLQDMQFIDFTNGWLMGHSSLALPRDPFVLITSDAGRSWRKVELYAESRVGIVEDFAFQSTKKGWLLVDNRGSGEAGRFELFETQNSGSTWDLREIATRIPKTATPGQRTPTATARVRPDAKKGLLRVELRENNAWKEISAFKLKLEDCKPAQP